jgi:hypothetical protein
MMNTARSRILLSLLLLLALLTDVSISDFVYADFNETAGLKFNGAAGTSNCFNNSLNNYGDNQGVSDRFTEEQPKEIGETTAIVSESFVETNVESTNTETTETLAGFIHRNDQKSSPKSCKVRSRLTPSGPSKAGSMWFIDPAPVVNGFDTFFTFQVSDHSKQCTFNKDQYLSIAHHRTCSVHGADGFAFVIQLTPETTAALGGVGEQMGFGGIANSLAVAFDMWQNPGKDTMHTDHISIQSKGRLPNDALEEGLLGAPRSASLADGNVHLARITYYSDLQSRYFDQLVASDSLLPYLKDNGEQKRIGTLVVFLDEGVESDTPIMALPINLSLLLDLPIDKAFVGFTSSTGRFYEKHDILSWTFCDQQPCKEKDIKDFDFHQSSKFSATTTRTFEPGPGYGTSGGDSSFPVKNISPDTSPWELPLQHWAKSRNIGLAPDAGSQVPDATLY